MSLRSIARRQTPLQRALVPFGLWLAASLIAWFRVPAAARGVMWAEDGTHFITDDRVHGLAQVLFQPYGGYLQFMPRIAAAVVDAVVPLQYAAVGMTVFACVAAGAVTALVYVLASDTLPSRPARALLALLPVLVASATVEVVGDLADFHSVVMCAGPWLLLHRPGSRRAAAAQAVIACAMALTEPQFIVFVPLMLWRLGDGRRWIVRGGLLLGLSAQVWAELAAPRASTGPLPFDLAGTVLGYLSQSVLASLTSSPQLIGNAMGTGAIAAAVAFAACIGAGTAAVVWGRTPQRLAAVALLVSSLTVWTASYNVNVSALSDRFADFDSAQWDGMTHPLRYGFASGVLLLGLLPLAAGVAREHLGRTAMPHRAPTVFAPALILPVVLVAVFAASWLPSVTVRNGGPNWQHGVDSATRRCVDRTPSSTVEIPEAPWVVTLPCSAVVDGATAQVHVGR